MNILVYDVAASSGGALTVLQEYSRKFKKDRQNQYYFVLSNYHIECSENFHIISFPWIKKSWFHRIIFDLFCAPKLIKKYKINQVISLQNTLFPFIRVRTKLLVHNAIPFCEHKFTIKESFTLWISQNIIGRFCIHSIKKADEVIVQNNWMKIACQKKTNISEEKIKVEPPSITSLSKTYHGAYRQSTTHFFYPASASLFKNHTVILDACKLLIAEKCGSFSVTFTLTGHENALSKKLLENVNKYQLPVKFMGWMQYEEVQEYYGKSVLLFPSYLETSGLPLFEAMSCGTPIVVADCQYAREAMSGYENVKFFSPHDVYSLFDCMKWHIKQRDVR